MAPGQRAAKSGGRPGANWQRRGTANHKRAFVGFADWWRNHRPKRAKMPHSIIPRPQGAGRPCYEAEPTPLATENSVGKPAALLALNAGTGKRVWRAPIPDLVPVRPQGWAGTSSFGAPANALAGPPGIDARREAEFARSGNDFGRIGPAVQSSVEDPAGALVLNPKLLALCETDSPTGEDFRRPDSVGETPTGATESPKAFGPLPFPSLRIRVLIDRPGGDLLVERCDFDARAEPVLE